MYKFNTRNQYYLLSTIAQYELTIHGLWYFLGPLESRITPLQLQLQELLDSLGERHTKQIVGRLSLNIT